MSQLSRYESYKDSGVQWLGEIPSHWDVTRLKFILAVKKNAIKVGPFGSDLKGDDFQTNGYPIYNQRTVLDNDFVEGTAFISEEKFKALVSFKIEPFDILVTTRGTIGKIAVAPEDVNEGIIHPCIMKFSINRYEITDQLLKYLFNEIDYVFNQFVLASGTTTIPVIYSDTLKNIILPLPPITEQKIIVDFLDKRLAQIDALIVKQKMLLEKLAEQRVALISNAVTKGLNPDRELKESDIEWFGSVPKHWTISKLSYSLSAIGDVDHYMPESIDDSGVPYVMTGNLKELVSDIDFEQCKQVSHDDYLKLSKKIKTSKGDIIFARYATIGTLSYVDIDKEFLVSYSCVTIKSNLEKLLGTYLYYYFKSDAFFKEVQKQINTNTQGNVGIDNLRRIKVLLPSLSEQEEIVDFLNIETRKIDDMKEVVEKTIERLKEYRSTLITQVVTGKIDVRNLKVN